MHVYVVGLFVPVIILAALGHVAPRLGRLLRHDRLRLGVLALALVYALPVAAGWYDDLVSELFHLSSA